MRVDVNGTRLYFDVEGLSLVPDGPILRQRPTVLLVHGGPGLDHASYLPDMSALAEDAQVIYLDHRGNGRSDDARPDQWNLSQWADDIAGFLDALEIEKPLVLGASVGGFIAQAFATTYPDRLSKLALLCTGARTDLELSVAAFAKVGGDDAGVAARYFLSGDMNHEAEFMEKCLQHYTVGPMDPNWLGRSIAKPEVLRHFFEAGGEWHTLDFRTALKKISVPTLILHGDRDPILPLALAKEIHDGIAGGLATLRVIEGVGHGWTDKPEEWIAHVRQFLMA